MQHVFKDSPALSVLTLELPFQGQPLSTLNHERSTTHDAPYLYSQMPITITTVAAPTHSLVNIGVGENPMTDRVPEGDIYYSIPFIKSMRSVPGLITGSWHKDDEPQTTPKDWPTGYPESQGMLAGEVASTITAVMDQCLVLRVLGEWLLTAYKLKARAMGLVKVIKTRTYWNPDAPELQTANTFILNCS